MGRYMRCFWIPAMTESEIPAADEPPVKLQLLGEKLIVFRDSEGRVGVMDENCPHRGASLYFGRNEEGGIRCVYHGWKFDVNGKCLELPSEPPGSPMQAKVRAHAYPARISGRVLWVYLGDADSMPPMPGFEWLGLPDENVYVSRWEQDCNYAQAMEGELDSAHVGFLHSLVKRTAGDDRALTGRFFQGDRAPLWKILPTVAGFMACNGRRVVDEDKRYWRLNQFLLPFFTMIPPHPSDARLVRMWVPMTDERCWVLCATFRPDRPLEERELTGWKNGDSAHRRVMPGTTKPTERLDNDYLIDRQMQKTQSFTGIHGVRAQDAMVTETAGPIADRTRENLGTSDRAVVAMRRALIDAAVALRDHGTKPESPVKPHVFGIRATQTVLPEGQDPATSDELMATARPRDLA
jgi:phenylpropionate dioxygenase-like ring-hydroxylating dioxygenase large terminal subunit